jgi:hypothetical protein
MNGVSCRSTFTTPFVAYAPLTLEITGTESEGTITMQSTFIDLVKPGPTPTTAPNKTTLTRGTMAAGPVEIYWKLNDLNSFSPKYAASLARALKMQVPSSTSTGTAKAPSVASQGLSPGAKAGIALGTIFGVVFAALGIYFVVVRSCSRSKRSGEEGEEKDKVEEDQSASMLVMKDQDREHASRRLFQNGAWMSEVDASSRPYEMNAGAGQDTVVVPVELESGYSRHH